MTISVSARLAFGLVAVSVLVGAEARSQSVSLLAAPRITYPQNGTRISTTVELRWTPVESAERYEVMLLIAGLSEWRDTVVTTTSVTLRGFLGDADYYVKVRALSAKDTTAWSDDEFYFSADLISVRELSNEQVRIFPNPAQSMLHVEGASDHLSLYDCRGVRVGVADRSTDGTAFDIRSLPSGTYLLSDGHSLIRSVRVER